MPRNLHKRSNNADTDLLGGGRIRPRSLQLSAMSMIRLASDRHRPSTTKNFLANFLETRNPDMETMPVEDLNLPTLHLN